MGKKIKPPFEHMHPFEHISRVITNLIEKNIWVELDTWVPLLDCLKTVEINGFLQFIIILVLLG